MSIFRKTMKALGFSGEDDEFEAQPYTAENITNACIREKERQDNESDVTPSASRVEKTKRRNCNSRYAARYIVRIIEQIASRLYIGRTG